MLNLETLAFDLPEDVLKHKWAGDFEGEIALIDSLLNKDISPTLKDRLRVERRIAQQLPAQFCIPRPLALVAIREKIPDFTEAELDALELDRAIEYIYVRGEKHYLHSFLDTLLRVNADFAARANFQSDNDRKDLTHAIAYLRENGCLRYRIGISAELKIKDRFFEKGACVRVHLPVPRTCAQQSQISVDAPRGSVDHEDVPQRTAYFERMMTENESFQVTYSYVNAVRYVDLFDEAKVDGVVYPNAAPPTQDDLSQQLPHIAFTPYLRTLAKELMGEETEPVRIAWRFYDYITTHIRYTDMRPYFLLDLHADFCALNGKGDCGIQAILFITLCRIAGIPARWQSGLAVNRQSAGCHDWAQFYVEPYGWLFCDPSYGGSAFRAGDEMRRRFYFGNLDPFRMVANGRYQTDFTPPKYCDRSDPYDNQVGEVELNGEGLLLSQFDTDYKTTEFSMICE